MAYKKTVIFTPPNLKDVRTLDEVKDILQRWINDVCDKLNRELTNIERG